MKTASPVLKRAIRRDYALYAQPRLIADWNMNRYIGVVADNIPSEDSEGYDAEMFPIEAIVEPIRPTKGISKARINEAVVGRDYDVVKWPSRYYICDDEDIYKYWTSPVQTNGIGVFSNHTDGQTKVRPHIIYDEQVSVNKIVIRLENYWATPDVFEVKIKETSGSGWTTIATSPAIQNDGEIILYYNGTGWSTTLPNWSNNDDDPDPINPDYDPDEDDDSEDDMLDEHESHHHHKSPYGWGSQWSASTAPMKSLRGVMLKVESMKGGYDLQGNQTYYRTKHPTEPGYIINMTGGEFSFCNVIEIGAHRQVNLTEYLLSVTDTFDMGESSFIYPMGTITSNTASFELSNIYGHFRKDNLQSPHYKFLEPNCEINLEYIYWIKGSHYVVQQFKMYTNVWAGQKTETVTVDCEDFSKYLKETTPRPALYENLSTPEIIWRLMDAIGFTNYEINRNDIVTHSQIPIFWVDGEKTMWEILDELAQATQTAIYFDGWGVLQVKTREAAFDDARTPDWTLLGKRRSGTGVGSQDDNSYAGSYSDDSGGSYSGHSKDLPDIVELNQTEEFEANHVTVSYQTTKWSDFNNGQPALQPVWEPSGTVVLRASDLKRTLDLSDVFFWISPKDVIHWPYEGIVNIQGELIRFDGRQYVYYTGTNGNVRNTVTINSEDERKKYRLKTPVGYRHKNNLTGGIRISERGVWNSEAKRHPVEAEGYNVRHIEGGVHRDNTAGFTHLRRDSTVRLRSGPRFKLSRDILLATRGQAVDGGFYYYGTMLKFVKDKGHPHQTAGLILHNNGGNDEDGYYIELKGNMNPKARKNRNELIFFSRKNGVNTRLGLYKGRGQALTIVEDVFYEIDISFVVEDGDHIFTIWINGVNAMVVRVTQASGLQNDWNGRFGMFLRGKTNVVFEYLYAIQRVENQPEDDYSFLDKARGGYRGGQWDREWTYRWRTNSRRKKRNTGKERSRWNRQFFDEFGPIVHEVREYSVKFDPNPVQHSRLYMSNDWSAVCTEYKGQPFGAKFIVANASRKNAVLDGADSLSYAGSSDSVDQTLSCIGRALVINEAEKVVAKDEQAIIARGKIEIELSSPWIQSKHAAQHLARWIRRHWSTGVDEQMVTIFGNPLIEVGDVVDVYYPYKSMAPSTHKYFVVGVANTFTKGIETALTLRRVITQSSGL